MPRWPARTTEQRYEEKVDRSGGPDACHPWTAGRTFQGYGTFRGDGEQRACRWAWKHYIGPIPPGMFVCHTCDNPPCQNRAHWFLGTVIDNNADKMAKGRFRTAYGDANGSRRHPESRPRGERVHSAKLTSDLVAELRARYAAGNVRQVDLAAEYGITQGHVSAIIRGAAWCP